MIGRWLGHKILAIRVDAIANTITPQNGKRQEDIWIESLNIFKLK